MAAARTMTNPKATNGVLRAGVKVVEVTIAARITGGTLFATVEVATTEVAAKR
jgi:hypothetical protein